MPSKTLSLSSPPTPHPPKKYFYSLFTNRIKKNPAFFPLILKNNVLFSKNQGIMMQYDFCKYPAKIVSWCSLSLSLKYLGGPHYDDLFKGK